MHSITYKYGGAMVMNQDDRNKLLNRICENCGEHFGRHMASDSECPITEGGRTVGFSNTQRFKEWTDDAHNIHT